MPNSVILEPVRSEIVVVGVASGNDRRNLIQIGFIKSDGSLFITFPYFVHSHGLLSVVTIPEGQLTGPVYLDKEGRCTSHRVKYSHHITGDARFSLTCKIRKGEIRRKSVPLRNAAGHLFTVVAQGITEFAAANRPKDRANLLTPKRTNLTFEVGEPMPEAIRIVGRLYDARKIPLVGEPPDRLGPTLPLRIGDDDKITSGFMIGNPHDSEDQMLLVVTCHLMTRVNFELQSVMLFMGGFDPPEQATDTCTATSFLAFTYPANNFDELQKLLGTVDLRSP
jgi:hypothetical protein